MKHKYPIYVMDYNDDHSIYVLKFTALTKASIVLDNDSNLQNRYPIGYTSSGWTPHTHYGWTPLNILQLKALGID